MIYKKYAIVWRGAFDSCEIFKMDLFAKTLNDFQQLAKQSILDVWLNSEYFFVLRDTLKAFDDFRNKQQKCKKE